jgi:hypothetical protein
MKFITVNSQLYPKYIYDYHQSYTPNTLIIIFNFLDCMVKVVCLQINLDLHFRFPCHWLWHQPQSIFDCFFKFPWNWLNLFKVFQVQRSVGKLNGHLWFPIYMCFIQTLIITCTIYEIQYVVYHWNEPVVSSHLQCTATYEVAAHRRDHCNWKAMTSYMCFLYVFHIHFCHNMHSSFETQWPWFDLSI